MNSRGRAPLAYRPCVGIVLLNSRGEVFVGRRLDTRYDAWQMPQGGIDAGEEPRQAALRELAEEIGTNEVEIIAETEDWLDYDLPGELMGEVWGGAYRGQTQKWFVARFKGEDADIDIDTALPEFREWKWAPFDELPANIVPFKRRIYETLVERFRHLAVPDGEGVDTDKSIK